jgi:trk system potassium uptake protein TrkA
VNIVILGCGRMGSGLAKALALRRHAVTVVDVDPGAFSRLGPAFPGRIVTGSAVDRETLLSAGVERADGVAAVTAGDEANVVCARLALQVYRVPRVVARLYDPLKADIYRRLGLQTVTPVTWAVHRMADLLCYSRLDAVASLGSGEVDIVETEVTPLLVGRTVTELFVPGEMRVVAVTREGRTFLPVDGTVFHKGDRLHIAVLGASAERLQSLLGPG